MITSGFGGQGEKSPVNGASVLFIPTESSYSTNFACNTIDYLSVSLTYGIMRLTFSVSNFIPVLTLAHQKHFCKTDKSLVLLCNQLAMVFMSSSMGSIQVFFKFIFFLLTKLDFLVDKYHRLGISIVLEKT